MPVRRDGAGAGCPRSRRRPPPSVAASWARRALFLAAVADANEPVTAWMERLPARAGTATLAANLTEALSRLASLREQMLPLELAMLTDPDLAARRRTALNALHAGEPTAALPDVPGPNAPALLAQYLAAEQALGRIRGDINPTRAAVTILAALMGLAIMTAHDPPDTHGQHPNTLIHDAADLLARGLQ